MSWQFTPIVGDRDIERNFRSLQAYLAALAAAPAQAVLTSASSANNTTTPADVTGLAFPVAANSRYAFEFYLVVTTGNTANGYQVGLTCPAGATLLAQARIPNTSDGSDAFIDGLIASSGDTVATATLVATPTIARVSGTLQTGANAGTLQLRQAANNAGGTGVAAAAGSCGVLFTLT